MQNLLHSYFCDHELATSVPKNVFRNVSNRVMDVQESCEQISIEDNSG